MVPNERQILEFASTHKRRHPAHERRIVASAVRARRRGDDRRLYLVLEDEMKCAECGMPVDGDDLFCSDACYDVFMYADEDEGLPPSPRLAPTENFDELTF